MRRLALVLWVGMTTAACGDLAQTGAGDASATTAPATDAATDTTNVEEATDPTSLPLEIRAVDPAEGDVLGGIDVMITGRAFREGLEVYFDQTPCSEVYVIGPTTAIVRLPPHPAGRVDVTVAHPDYERGAPQILPAAFRYFGAIQVTAVTPAEGHEDGGDAVQVTGRGFTADARAFIGGRPLIQQAVGGDGLITGIAPPGPWGPADVQVVGFNGTAVLPDAYTYGAPPRIAALSPVNGAAGTHVVIEGHAFSPDAEVVFGATSAEVVSVARDGSRLEVVAPAGAGVVDVRVQTRWGLDTWPAAFGYDDATADPLVLACTHLGPATGPSAGGNLVAIACRGLAYPDLQVRFGSARAELARLEVAAGRATVVAPPGEGEVTVHVSTAVAATDVPVPYRYAAEAAVAVTAIEPATGPPAGGTPVVIRGRGFASGAVVQIGALPASTARVVDDQTIEATTAPGAPGAADVIVRQSGVVARLAGGFDYRADDLALALVAPPTAAQAGGTYLRVYGEGFGPDAVVTIGGAPCPVERRVGSAELHVRSPHLAVGTYDAVVTDGARQATLERALTTYDPRSGYGGTWGPPIDETVNVTVYGGGGYGPVAGAFVMIGHDPSTPWQGVTDEDGQVTLSGPGLYGPVEVTASREGFTSYSVVAFDATNVTIILQQNPTPPPAQGSGGDDDPPPPNATISGHVRGLGKYVLAPPGSCEAAAIADTQHCRACGPDAPVPQCEASVDGGVTADAPAFACVPMGDDGPRCLAACALDADCPKGYRCGPTAGDDGAVAARCVPSLGAPAAYCNIASPSLFGYEYPIQPTGWADNAGYYQIDSQRLGEVAVYCFGGYKDDAGAFTPTVMGVVRHIFAGPGELHEDVDVELDTPLDRSFRLRLQDPPTWASGPLNPPQIVISLDLGADGVIPFSRVLVPGADDVTWIAPHELSRLSGELYDAQYFFYTTLSPADVATYQPRAYNLVQNVQRIVEDRFPVRSADGEWRLEGTQLERDLYAVWAAPDGQAAFAVGEDGVILGWTEAGWTAQTSFTEQALRAVAGRPGDLWAVGDGGTVRHWDGLAWQAPAASPPSDSLVAVAATDDAVYAAGAIRLRRMDRATGAWDVVGGPSLQEVRGLYALPDGRVLALGAHRRAWVRAAGAAETWTPVAIAPPDVDAPLGAAEATLRAALVRADGALLVVGDRGTILTTDGPVATDLTLTLAPVFSPTSLDLLALTETATGELVVVGDHGTALTATGDEAFRVTEIHDYRSEAHGVFVDAGGEVRVIGSAAFILGPFLHFPMVTSPVHDAALDALAFAWTWDGGPSNQYTQLRLTPEASITLWTLVVDGAVTSITLPDLELAAGISALPTGRIRFEVLRVLNRDFDIDGYTTREFSVYMRDSWSTNEAWFYLP